MVRDWTLPETDQAEVGRYRKYSLFVAIQLCAVRLYGRFLSDVHELSPRIINYLNSQLDRPPSLTVPVPLREATYIDQRRNILSYLGFQKFDEPVQEQLERWLREQAIQGVLPDKLFAQAEQYLLANRILLPGPTVLERLVIRITAEVHTDQFQSIYQRLPPELRVSIDRLLTVKEGEQRSFFYQLKEYPPAAKISSLKKYLKRYQELSQVGIDLFDAPITEPAFQAYLFQLTKKYSAKEIKRFNEYKRYALVICFLLESRRALLDHLVNMHDQYILEIVRQSKNAYEKKHRQFRKRQKKAVDVMLNASQLLLDWPDEEPMPLRTLWRQVGKGRYQSSVADLREFKQLNDHGYGDLLLNRYPSLRKYFADFVHLPFKAERGSEALMNAIRLVRQLDSEERKQLPTDTPISFIPRDMRPLLTDKTGKIQRNAWEMGLALAMKDALRSGDLYLPQSKQHVSFWSFLFSDEQWQAMQETSYIELQQPRQPEALTTLTSRFNEIVSSAQERFPNDKYAQIIDGTLKLKRHDKASKPDAVTRIQAGIDSSLPSIRIEKLLMEVDKVTQFTAQFLPIQGRARPRLFYKTLISFLISQATNLGLVAMSASVKDVSVDMMRHVQDFFVREETIQAANTAIVDKHHQLPLSAVYGAGAMSSSDAQRFGIRASSLLASYYPRYYGCYRKAIGIYTHVSDQYSVFSTKVISCGPREALYVLDGLLENNTVLPVKKHTADTHGYTEIIFALCYLLGYDFMPRIRDLKDQQLYRIDKYADYGVFDPLLTKSADLYIIQEQWDEMIRVAFSLLNRTVPAHLIVQRLTASYPSDRLSKAFTNLGRIIKTQYILRYLTDRDLRHSVQRQLNKGEYRHKLPRWIFFAGQGEFMTGDYEEIMNKASCLSLVSNAILYWNTVKIQAIVKDMRQRGEDISDEALSHISLLPYKHVLPNGTYFIDDYRGGSMPKPTVSDNETSSQP